MDKGLAEKILKLVPKAKLKHGVLEISSRLHAERISKSYPWKLYFDSSSSPFGVPISFKVDEIDLGDNDPEFQKACNKREEYLENKEQKELEKKMRRSLAPLYVRVGEVLNKIMSR